MSLSKNISQLSDETKYNQDKTSRPRTSREESDSTLTRRTTRELFRGSKPIPKLDLTPEADQAAQLTIPGNSTDSPSSSSSPHNRSSNSSSSSRTRTEGSVTSGRTPLSGGFQGGERCLSRCWTPPPLAWEGKGREGSSMRTCRRTCRTWRTSSAGWEATRSRTWAGPFSNEEIRIRTKIKDRDNKQDSTTSQIF